MHPPLHAETPRSLRHERWTGEIDLTVFDDEREGNPMATTGALVGRDGELAVLAEQLDAAGTGHGGVVLVGGDPGVGKTRLMEEVVAVAEQRGTAVVWATCCQGDAAPPLWPWCQVLRQLPTSGDGTRGDLERLVGSCGLLGNVDPSSARSRLLDQVVGHLTTAAGSHPLLIVIDDLQWADRTSVELLALVESAARTAPLLLVAGYRSTETEVNRPLGDLLAALPRGVGRIDLRGLSRLDIGRLATEVAGRALDDELVASLRDHTGGNPFFVTELVRLRIAQRRLPSAAGMPASVREVLDRHVARRSQSCRELLGAAAVIGREFTAEFVQTVLGREPDRLVSDLDEAVQADIIVERGSGRFAFVHDLFCHAVYDGLGTARRSRLHLAAGEALEEWGPGAAAPELAHHFLAAAPLGGVDRAVRCARDAGEQAARLCAFDQAVAHFERGLAALPPGERSARRAELLVGLGDALWRSQQVEPAREVLDDAAHLARVVDEPVLFAQAALGYACGPGGDQDPSASADHHLIAMMEEALARLPEGDTVLWCRVAARLAVELYLTPRHDRRVELTADALAMARRLDDPSALAAVLYARTSTLLGPDELAEREAAAEEMHTLAWQAGDTELAYWAHLLETWTLAQGGHRPDDGLRAAAALAAELRVPGYQAEVAVRQAIQETIAGDFDAAGQHIDEARDHTGAGAPLPVLLSAMTLDSWLRGPLDDLVPLVADLVDQHPDVPMWRAGLACLCAELGDADGAARHLDELARRDFDIPRNHLWLVAMHFAATACAAVGSAEHAARLHELVAPYADQTTIGTFCSMSAVLGILDGARGRDDDALRLLDLGRDRNECFGNHAFALWTERERAAVLLRRDGPGDLDEGGALLDQVIVDMEAAGFTGLTVRANELRTATARRRMRRGDGRCRLRREGDWWVAVLGDHETPLPRAKGFEDLAALVAAPEQEIHAADLAGTVHEGSTGELVDAEARTAYKARITDLEDDIDEAEARGDIGRAESARAERDELIAHLSTAFGLGGRARRSGDTVEKARKAVTWRIRRAIRVAEAANSSLGRHLDQTIRTGTYCSYQPSLAHSGATP